MADRDNTATFVDLVLAIILPPLGVFLKYGCALLQNSRSDPFRAVGRPQIEFWICLLLSLFGYLPGIIYAVWAILKE
ncbi:hypothetical protein EJB05_06444, partial [Eragrostis curvula]